MKKIPRFGLAALAVSGVFLVTQISSAAVASNSVSYNIDTASDLAAGFTSYITFSADRDRYFDTRTEARVVSADSGFVVVPTVAATGTSSESLTSTSSLAVATIALGAALLLRRRILGHR
jgi:MYXO-CTERM domain-containing protein